MTLVRSALPLVVALLSQAALGATKPRKAPPAPPAAVAPAPAAPQPSPATPPAATSRKETAEKEVREIPLDDKRANKVYRIRTAIGYPAVVEFPDAFAGPPSCGDCGDKGLFRLDVFDEQHYLTVKPRLFPGPQADGSVIQEDEFVTTVNVRLSSQITLTLQVELSDREKADPRVVFTLPQRANESAYVRTEIEKAKAKMEADFADRIQAGVKTSYLRSLLQPHSCSNASVRSRVDDIVLEVRELCYFGNAYFVRFTVENRGRTPFALSDVTIAKRTGRSSSPVTDATFYASSTEVEFQKTSTIVVGFELAEGERPASSYDVTVSEKGGRNRIVLAHDFGF